MSEPKLTPEQEKAVDAYGLEMLQNGTKAGIKTDRKKAKEAVSILYKKYLDLPEPEKVVFVDSPEKAIQIVAKSQKKEPKNLVSEVQFLNLWTWWVAYYWVGVNLLKETDGVEADLIQGINEYEAITRTIHAVLPCEKICFVIEYPKRISILNNDLEKFQLHQEGGFALEYQDGTGFSWLRGVEVPDWIAVTPASKLSVKKVMAETNVDIRREGLRRIPLAKLLKDTKAKLLDQEKKPKKGKHWDYQLYEVDLGDQKKRVCLRMYDVASDGYPIERVEDTCTTVLQALAMRDGEENYRAPSIRT
jgi:hypothetical protein